MISTKKGFERSNWDQRPSAHLSCSKVAIANVIFERPTRKAAQTRCFGEADGNLLYFCCVCHALIFAHLRN